MNGHRCDRCGEEATIHEYTPSKGKVLSETHLCEKCAQELGMEGKVVKGSQELLQQLILAKAGRRKAPVSTTCRSCGLSWGEFREHSLLGCPDCYAVFENQLGPLLERIHEGATHHVGKTPVNQNLDLAQRLTHLRKKLAEALAAEQYERAAKIRDELLDLGSGESPPPAEGGESAGSLRA
ncbi:MAG: UvrB/UvrC motif-containing protein [Phycisphaerales bacterium]|nr:UvrB/UvrC motif-containing protein [Phycisphaerales bacterium]